MPNCFCLFPKGSREPAILQAVDAAMCKHFDVPVHPTEWLAGWYLVIGSLIACKGFPLGSPELRAAVIDWYDEDGGFYRTLPDAERCEYRDRMLLLLDYLTERYTSDAWAEIGRR